MLQLVPGLLARVLVLRREGVLLLQVVTAPAHQPGQGAAPLALRDRHRVGPVLVEIVTVEVPPSGPRASHLARVVPQAGRGLLLPPRLPTQPVASLRPTKSKPFAMDDHCTK